MSYILSRKYARKSDSDFVVAAARAFYCDYMLSAHETRYSRSGAELTELVPETQRWAFRQAREFAQKIMTQVGMPTADISIVIAEWFKDWDGDRDATEENAGWYAAMQAMGHGVGLYDAGRIEFDVPHTEAFPTYSAREMKNRGRS